MEDEVDIWVEAIMKKIAPLRIVSPTVREEQKQILKRFRTLHFNSISQVALDESQVRGDVFEALVKSDLTIPEQNNIERRCGEYLALALKYDAFGIGTTSQLANPDLICTRITGDTVEITCIVEVKLGRLRSEEITQLDSIVNALDALTWVVRSHLASQVQLPEARGIKWPGAVKQFKRTVDYQRLVFLPADRQTFRDTRDWIERQSPFTSQEVAVIVDWLWARFTKEGFIERK